MKNMMVSWAGCLMLAAAVTGCTEKSHQCTSDSECPAALPFCDVNGEFPESGGEKNVCTIVPATCPVERCGCSAGATTCTGMTLTTCNADGKSATTSTCAIGCTADGLGCMTFDPSNNLGPALGLAGSEPDIVLPSGTRIDTGSGDVTAPNSTSLAVKTVALVQGDVTIRVFIAHSFDIADVAVSGPNPVAFVATGRIYVRGHLDVSATGTTPGAGAQLSATAACAGQASGKGGGGAGGATMGAQSGGFLYAAGGAAVQGFSPLRGGCTGGVAYDFASNVAGAGGLGGGAVQFVSQTLFEIASGGIVDVGGSGGAGGGGGGGAGGTVVIEAPNVALDALSSIVANGGAGGACGVPGGDGRTDGVAAQPGPACGSSTTAVGGTGGTGAAAPGNGTSTSTMNNVDQAGGGGSAGSIRIATLTGTFMSSMNTLLSGAVTTAVIAVH